MEDFEIELEVTEIDGDDIKFNINFEIIEMNMLLLSSEDGADRFYNLEKWTIGTAVENYIEEELMG